MLGNIEAERKRNQIKQKEMAEMLGVSLKTYHNWVNKKTDMPISCLIKISDTFQVTTDYLLGKTDRNAICREEGNDNRHMGTHIYPGSVWGNGDHKAPAD